MTIEFGWTEGETCKRDGCEGTIEIAPSENCSCHLSAPCHSCTSPRAVCSECAWREEDEPEPPYIPGAIYISPFGAWWAPEARTLDNTKVDWYDKPHSGCSMIKEGVYPLHMSREEVRKVVDGTFGGRFEYFVDGKFKFIAYTD